MSGIFGLFNKDGAPVDPDLLETMRAAMAYWGPDGGGIWHDGPCGLGQLLLYNTPEALYERLPRKLPQRRLAITAEARIDNRHELCDWFAIPPSERPQTPDSELILLAYEKWGEDCSDHLLGDWSFAIWNSAERRLFLARDHHGNTTLFYCHDAHRFAFASSRKALLALGVPRRLNELYLAQVLTSWPAYHGPTTIDLDIACLPPAHAMSVTPERLDVQRYWYLEHTPALRLPSLDDYVAGFQEVYAEGVRCRLRSYRPVGVTLSGGLDSGSVAALAARELRGQGKTLPAFTSVPIGDVSNTVGTNRFGDETPYAQATAHHAGNIVLHPLTSEHISPVAGIRRSLEMLDTPSHAPSNAFWIQDILETAQQQGLGTLLTGQGGNATISWTGAPEFYSLRALLRQQGWKAVAKRATPPFLLHAYRQRRSDRQTWQGTAIAAGFARRLGLSRRRAAASADMTLPDSWRRPQDKRCAIIKPGRSLLGGLWAMNAAAYGLEVRDPTLDKRVLTYTLAIPDSIFAGSNGLDRWLIREAMAGLLPDEVRLNRRRGLQAADLGQRLLRTVPEMDEALAECAGSERVTHYLDVGRMHSVWTNLQVEVNTETAHRAVTVLLRGLMAGLFLAGPAARKEGHM
ncbi:MAG: asparagine synthetase B [Chloroflexi bacterium]|nr:asparagine synthetase B [Chloroflexota bacterium]